MERSAADKSTLLTYILTLVFIGLFGLWIKGMDIASGREAAGLIIFSLGFVMLSAYVLARIVEWVHVPLISGYILAGIIAGPYVSGFLTDDMVGRLRLIDDLALGFIALMAGGELRLALISRRARSIVLNIVLITLLVTGLVSVSILGLGQFFDVTREFDFQRLAIFSVLAGLICVTLSPASAIAVIKECRARGPFTGMILAVTIALDVLIITLFTVGVSLSKILVTGGSIFQLTEISGLIFEILAALLVGVIVGQTICFYMARVRQDLVMFLLFMTFAVARLSLGFNEWMEVQYNISLHLEPLLICMSAGFYIQNFTRFGGELIEGLEKAALPVYVLFFSIAGASLDFDSLMICWPLAVLLVGVRVAGLMGGSWLAGIASNDPAVFNRNAWMTYVPQAGVSIGLAQIAARQFPEIGIHLNTLVLGIIAINQIAGPVTFKLALSNVGESGRAKTGQG